MKKPSLKRKKKPAAPQPVTPASPFEPIPVKPSRRAVRKEKKAAAARSKPVPEPKVKRKDRPKQPGKRPGGALGKPFRLLGTSFGKLGRLEGRARIVAFGLLAVVVVALLLQLRGGRDDEQEVRQALARYETASAKKDVQTLCDELLSKSYVRQTASSGLPCEVALRTALEDVRNPTLEVLSVKVDGDKADARVRGSAAGQVPGEDTYRLVLEDDAWRIQPPTGASTTP